jgi:hypothetical protein
VSGDAQLAHEKYVEWRAELTGDLIPDGHAAPRQGEHHHVGAFGVRRELSGELASRIAPITKGWLDVCT